MSSLPNALGFLRFAGGFGFFHLVCVYLGRENAQQCVCARVCRSVCFTAYGGMKSLQSLEAHWALLCLFLTAVWLISPLYTHTFVFTPVRRVCFWAHARGIPFHWKTSPSAPSETLVPTGEPPAHQSRSPSPLPRRETDTQRRRPPDPQGSQKCLRGEDTTDINTTLGGERRCAA